MAPKEKQKIEIEKSHRDPLLSFNQAVTVDCSDFLGTALAQTNDTAFRTGQDALRGDTFGALLDQVCRSFGCPGRLGCGHGSQSVKWCGALGCQARISLAQNFLEARNSWVQAMSGMATQCSARIGSGAPGVIRTRDPLLRRQTLYPTELRAH